MSDTVYLTPAQVLAAKLAIELSQEDGEEPDEALKAIANAEVVTDSEVEGLRKWAGIGDWAAANPLAKRLVEQGDVPLRFGGAVDTAAMVSKPPSWALDRSSVKRTADRTDLVAPGYEQIAQTAALVLQMLQSLHDVNLSKDDEQSAEAEANKVLEEVTKPKPSRTRIRRSLLALKGFLAPVALGLSNNAGLGAQELAKKAIEDLDAPALPD